MVRQLTQLAAVALATVFAGTLAAQPTTWIVNQAGGAGSHFTNIPPALQVAQHGDTILVRDGTYDGGSITRSIALIADGANVVVRVGQGFFPSAFEVDGLPAGKTVVIDGFQPLLPTAGFTDLSWSFVRLSNCRGRVHCEGLHGSLINATFNLAFVGVSIGACDHVSIHGCQLSDGTPVSALQSTVVITDSVLRGQIALSGFGSHIDSSPGISTTRSRLAGARSRIEGGRGGFSLSFILDPSAAIEVAGGDVTVAGDATTQITAGSSLGFFYTPTPALGGFGAITVDPRVVLTPTNGAPPIEPSLTAVFARIPSIAATAGAPGGTLDLEPTAGDLAEIYLSLPFGPVPSPIPGSGEIWIDFGAFVSLGRVQVPASEQLRYSIPLPPSSVLRGVPITIQALTASAAAGFRFSTPATPVLE